jgi:hypothetical protein
MITRVVLRPRLVRRWLGVVGVSAIVAGLWARPAIATISQGFCRVSLPVTISAPHRGDSAVRAFASRTGSATCTGRLGPWLTGGQPGWSTAAGTFTTSTGGEPSPSTGHGHLWATVPRFTWFHPPMLTFTTVFRLRSVGGDLLLSGSGRLVPTVNSPTAAAFTIRGTARLTSRPRRTSATGARHGLLTLQFAIKTGPSRADGRGKLHRRVCPNLAVGAESIGGG